jgi:hypothetical protein
VVRARTESLVRVAARFSQSIPGSISKVVPAKRLKLRRPGVCVRCGAELTAGTSAWWEPEERTVTCLTCHPTPAPSPPAPEPAELEVFDHGYAGASLGRAYDRRKARREQRVREAHPRIGELLLKWHAPQHETAFRQGQLAEESVAESLERRTADGPTMLLHNRRMPRGRGDIDHMAVAPTGVFVIDTKDWGGAVRVESPLFGTPKLFVGSRDRTKLVDGLDRQVAAVRDALDALGHSEITIQGIFCLTRADKPLFGTTRFRGHMLLYRKTLAKRLNAAGDLNADTIQTVARELAHAFPPA